MSGKVKFTIKFRPNLNAENYSKRKAEFRREEISTLADLKNKVVSSKDVAYDFDICIKVDEKKPEEKLEEHNYVQLLDLALKSGKESPDNNLKIRLVQAAPQEQVAQPVSHVPEPTNQVAQAIKSVLETDIIKTFILRKLNAAAVQPGDRIRTEDTLEYQPTADFGELLKSTLQAALKSPS